MIPFKTIENMPIQSAAAEGAAGRIVIGEEFVEGLKDLEGFSHIHVIFQFQISTGWYKDKPKNLYDTRSADRFK